MLTTDKSNPDTLGAISQLTENEMAGTWKSGGYTVARTGVDKTSKYASARYPSAASGKSRMTGSGSRGGSIKPTKMHGSR